MIPAVLALLGDNPMQSEFACHIGLRGKLFCWACWVKGSPNPDPDTRGRSKSRKEETVDQLHSYFQEASTLDTKMKVKKMQTNTGIKDTYQMHFLDGLFDSYKKKRGRESKQNSLNSKLAELPRHITSPVWRIKGN